MFTGNIDEFGTVVVVDQARIAVGAPKAATGVPGSSHLSGVRLTVLKAAHENDVLQAWLSAGTRRRSTLAERADHTEATVAMCVAAGLPPVGLCCEVMKPDGTMAQAADLEIAALHWGLPLLDVAGLRNDL